MSLDNNTHHDSSLKSKRFWALMVGCLGVVYGDIGTSPLYAFREAIIHLTNNGVLPPEDVYGILSLILWSLFIIVTLKYVLFLLKVDNAGEGGILSLMALARKAVDTRWAGFITVLGLIGAALFYGDAAITPAISVMSAVEGLKLVSPVFSHVVLPITIIILVVLFILQKKGTGRVASLFGPITVIWFLVLGFIGVTWILKNPTVLLAINPTYAVHFLIAHKMMSFVVLGGIFLAVTGAEALYADLGHFGRKPIQRAWLWLVFPSLSLNYLGQGALILMDPSAIENPFYRLFPEWALLPMVWFATIAAVIASQAVITGAFSLTQQAVHLELLPRMEIRHTSADTAGQIYMPKINNFILFAVLFLCVVFKTSGALASAYGIAVVGTMIVTTTMAFFVIWKIRHKSLLFSIIAVLPFLIIELVFLKANALKIFQGGFVPLMFASFLITLMLIWIKGARYLHTKAMAQSIPLVKMIKELEKNPPQRVEGTAVYLTSDPSYSPMALLQNLKHNKVLHELNIVLTVITTHYPKAPEHMRLIIEPLSNSIVRIFASYGFMEVPDIPKALALAKEQYGLDINVDEVSYFLGRRAIVSDPVNGLPKWQDNVFIALSKTASTATDFYCLPPDRVVELGVQLTV